MKVLLHFTFPHELKDAALISRPMFQFISCLCASRCIGPLICPCMVLYAMGPLTAGARTPGGAEEFFIPYLVYSLTKYSYYSAYYACVLDWLSNMLTSLCIFSTHLSVLCIMTQFRAAISFLNTNCAIRAKHFCLVLRFGDWEEEQTEHLYTELDSPVYRTGLCLNGLFVHVKTALSDHQNSLWTHHRIL